MSARAVCPQCLGPHAECPYEPAEARAIRAARPVRPVGTGQDMTVVTYAVPGPLPGGSSALQAASRRVWPSNPARQRRYRQRKAVTLTPVALARWRALEAGRVRAWRMQRKPGRPVPRCYPDLAVLRAYRLGRIPLSAYLAARATLPAGDRA
jgi:hypothetical protein